jgi:antitoxin ParD1/3/4
MATMNVSLPDKMKQWVEDQVATGRYGNSSDYVRDLVRRDQERAEARASLYKLLDEGFEGGFSEEQSAEDIFEEARREMSAADDAA